MKGYLDRIEDNTFGVLLVEELNKEFMIPVAELPAGSTAGTHFDVTLENNKIVTIKVNEVATKAEQQKVDDRMTKIRSKSKGSKFQKK
ncbi:DUF3006 domain-containing protein [Bacillus sp. Marseille-P3661]|uniref:DUF3006 domain-containing protein n=1 Tax=Bacillus sp. Marseille-P3661 TaxID=1936234 RepID=UPI000C862B06|nr:DUF3006 domain-containing protein [Bacillus sp. Marseille-P3661]